MTGACFCWVVALKPEARPLIERFSLKRDDLASQGGFPVFRNDASHIWLTISGPGKINSAAATSWLRAQVSAPAAWINFGIAGGLVGNLGELFRAGKVRDEASGRSWYPQAVWPRKFDLPVAEIITVDRPREDYPKGATLIEMEASGFFPIACKFGGNELAHVFKVVSDTAENPIRDIDSNLVGKICSDALELMVPVLGVMDDLIIEESLRLGDPELFVEICENWHFSATNRHQLRRLLQQWDALKPDGKALSQDWLVTQNCRNGRDVIKLLREKLWPKGLD